MYLRAHEIDQLCIPRVKRFIHDAFGRVQKSRTAINLIKSINDLHCLRIINSNQFEGLNASLSPLSAARDEL
jgi:hypothetical protein